MKRINEDLMKKLAYEERLVFYRLADKKEIAENEIYGSLQMVESLTKLNLNSTGFNVESMNVVGIDTCCNYFKALCEQYHDLIVNGEDGEYIANKKRMHIKVGSRIQQVTPRVVEIGLYDAAKIIDNAVSENYKDLINGTMRGNDEKMVYQYAMFNTFAEMYYAIRDLVEGKSYYDGDFMTENRELPEEYERQSISLVSSFLEREKLSYYNIGKTKLISSLNEGIDHLKDIPLELLIANEQKKDNNKYSVDNIFEEIKQRTI